MYMKLFLQFAAVLFSINLSAQNSDSKLWNPTSEKDINLSGKRQIVPNKYLTYSLALNDLKMQLASAPNERAGDINSSNCIISIPAPNGDIQLFKVVEASIMEAPLAASYPNIKTYSIKGITDLYANGKIDYNEFGFHAMIRSTSGDYFVDPYCLDNTQDYITYYTADFEKPEQDRMQESGPIVYDEVKKKISTSENSLAACMGGTLRIYRLAIACTGEYAVAATGNANPTVAQTLAKIVTSINRVNTVYETEIAVRLVLVATETTVIFTNGSTDPFNNTNASVLIGQSHSVITATIGTANFDIGHTFSTGGGGLAGLGVVCNSTNKGEGITGSSSPVGDPYDIDYVAHEMGHQFRGNHTFNATTSSCSGNRNAPTSIEPGSGVTIMGYAGICGSTNDLASNSIPYFHGTSYDEIVGFLTTGGGSTCGTTSTTANQPPVVTGSSNYVIPVSTPFILTGSATDPNGDPLTYSWEETDPGPSAGNWNSGTKPFFRSYVPTASTSRSFPILSSVLSNNLQGVKGEFLPSTAQTLNFRLTARDNKMGGGGICSANNAITVNAAGPFDITYPNSTGIVWGMGMQQNVTWNVNGTNVAPINTASVNILISYNSGNTFTTLVSNTANDGLELVTVPTLTADIATCRIKIEAVGNVYYDINNPNFTIAANVTGLSEISGVNTLGMNVFPNPFENNFKLAVSALNSNLQTNVVITDVLGKVIKTESYNKVTMLNESIDMSAFDSGVYFITVSNDGKKSTGRVVKN